MDRNTVVQFHSLIPIFREEMELALSDGSNDLLERLGEANVSELIDVNRENACG